MYAASARATSGDGTSKYLGPYWQGMLQSSYNFEQNKQSNVPSNEIFENHGGKEYVCNEKVPKIGAEEISLVDAFGFGLP